VRQLDGEVRRLAGRRVRRAVRLNRRVEEKRSASA